MKEKEGIVGFAFGKPRSIPANNIISMIVSRKARKLKAPAFIQFDILILDPEIEVFYAKEYSHQDITTYEVASQAINWAIKNNIKKLYIVAAPPHLFRVTGDFDYISKEKNAEIEFQICKEVYNKKYKSNWFCEMSKQWWTRRKIFFWVREMALLFMPIFLYKKIADKGKAHDEF